MSTTSQPASLRALLVVSAACLLLHTFGCAEDPSAQDDKFCTVREDSDGVVTIDCPDSSVQIDPCYKELPDLDGSGAADENDCRLAGVGAAERRLCDSPLAWSTLESCRAATTSTLSDSFWSSPATVLVNGRMVVVFADSSGGVHLWRDNNSDLAVDSATEITSLSALSAFGVYMVPYVVRDSGNCLAAITFAPTTHSVRYWRDRNCNGLAEPDEAALLPLASPGYTVNWSQLVSWNGIPIVLFTEDAGANNPSHLSAWNDLDNDLLIDPGEVLQLYESPISRLAAFQGLVYPGALNHVTYVRFNTGSGDSLVPNAVWSFGSQWSLASGSMSTPSERDSRCVKMSWLSESQFACIDAGLLVTLGYVEWTVAPTVVVDEAVGSEDLFVGFDIGTGITYVSFKKRYAGVLWTDLDGDRTAARSEILTVPNAIQSHFLNEAPVFFRFPQGGVQGRLVVERWQPRTWTRFLGESCGLPFQQCAGDLECRVSGNATDARCVPVAAQ